MKRRSRGFTLTELLIAISVATVVGGAILSILLYSFEIWTDTTSRGRAIEATDAFDLSFARDFACSSPDLGFEGDSTSCSFWTYRLSGDRAERLVHVSYEIVDGAIESESTPYPATTEDMVLRDRFPTKAFRGFTYYGTNVQAQAGVPLWNAPSNSPERVSLRLHLPPEAPRVRFYRRRTP